MIKFLKYRIKKILRLIKRFLCAYSYRPPFFKEVFRWLYNSSETTNFTYHITERNLFHICSTLSSILNVPYQKVLDLSKEPYSDSLFIQSLVRKLLDNSACNDLDLEVRFGRRIGWYIIVRILKPRIIVETGIAPGLGSALMCYALHKNEKEDNITGKYYGLDINKTTGFLIPDDLKKYGQLIFDDSLNTLKSFENKIDLFINDSDHSSIHERKEYELVNDMLSNNSIIIGDNAHVTDELLNFSTNSKRKFIFIREEPKNHWYPGGGIGLSYKQ